MEEEGNLRSLALTLSGKYCFSLDFYLLSPSKPNLISSKRGASLSIYGEEISVATGEQNGRSQSYSLFARNQLSSFVDKWQSHKKTVNFRKGQYQIVIDARTVFLGSLAIDNLKFTDGSCAEDENDEKYCDFDAIVGSADETNLNCDWMEIVSLPPNTSQYAIENSDNVLWGGYGRVAITRLRQSSEDG